MKLSEFLGFQISETEDILRNMMVRNLRIVRILAFILIAFEIIISFVIIFIYFHKPIEGYQLRDYLIMCLIMVLYNIGYLLLIRKADTKVMSVNQLRKIEISLVAYITFIMSWGSVVSLIDQRLYGNLMVFMVNIIICSVLFLLNNKKILVPYVCSVFILIIGLPFFQNNAAVLFSNYVNLVMFIIVSWIASRIIFVSHYNHFRIQEQNCAVHTQLTTANMLLAEANKKLQKLAELDELTGIPNRRSFRNYIDDLADENFDEHNSTLTIIMIDIDHFKQYNDHYGHIEGDKIIRAIAKEIQVTIRGSMEFLARWGGEEFICLAFNKDEDDLIILSETIRKNIYLLNLPHKYSCCSDYITVSIGVCYIRINSSKDIRKGIVLADKALYLAKKSGRNCVKTGKQLINQESTE